MRDLDELALELRPRHGARLTRAQKRVARAWLAEHELGDETPA